ncbi:hypothetical protein BU14_1385s0002 [Porphyra umbilicalis]|uniref:Uncharacterized protein n=1 Tax=Porphyra umbilicalis TaxID=2786 RepID=A0A1X6NLP6_PORUM|nr:hypothetical protein BU14_1385s0002 [Porphyra umbilicalis]|eukprot:OSX69569.1 hypothetical protein BU14_1385s0002 [Porphyra umbilicalis]
MRRRQRGSASALRVRRAVDEKGRHRARVGSTGPPRVPRAFEKNDVHAGAPTTGPAPTPLRDRRDVRARRHVLPTRGFPTPRPRRRSQAGDFWGAASSPWDTHPREARERHTPALVEGPDDARALALHPDAHPADPPPAPARRRRSKRPPPPKRGAQTHAPATRGWGGQARRRAGADEPVAWQAAAGRRRATRPPPTAMSRRWAAHSHAHNQESSGHAAARSAACNPTLGQAMFKAAAAPVALVPRWALSPPPPTPPYAAWPPTTGPTPGPGRRPRTASVGKWGGRRGCGSGWDAATQRPQGTGPPTPVQKSKCPETDGLWQHGNVWRGGCCPQSAAIGARGLVRGTIGAAPYPVAAATATRVQGAPATDRQAAPETRVRTRTPAPQARWLAKTCTRGSLVGDGATVSESPQH